MTLRQGIEKSRNLMTVRLAQDVGMDKICEMSKRIGVNQNLPKLLSMSLGAGDTRLIDMASAYAVIVNGGKKVEPYFIERIQNRDGKTILKQDKRSCENCNADKFENQEIPHLPDAREQIVDPLSAYQMTSILEGVAQRGTGARLRSIGRHLAGKTGTSNQNKDAWFMGFSPDLVVGVYVGVDEPRTLAQRNRRCRRSADILRLYERGAGQPAGYSVPHAAGHQACPYQSRYRQTGGSDRQIGNRRSPEAGF